MIETSIKRELIRIVEYQQKRSQDPRKHLAWGALEQTLTAKS